MRASALLAVLTAAVLSAGAALGAADELRIVIASADGMHAAASLPLSESERATAKHLWIWTAQHAPRKVDPAGAGRVPSAAELLAELSGGPLRRVEVRVHGWSRPEDLSALRLIAAPAEMWGSVPEPLLPSYTLSKEGRTVIPARDAVRLRVVGPGYGTTWQQLGRTARSGDIGLRRPAADAEVVFRASDGGPAGRVFALVMSGRRGDATQAVQAQFVGEDKGIVRIPALPESEAITLFVLTERAAPHTVSGTAADLSRTIRLPAPAEIACRFVDEENRPLQGVRVDAEGWVSADAPAASRGSAVSDETGLWVIRGLPRTGILLRAAIPGRSAFRKRVSLEGDLDLGSIRMLPSREVVLTVVDGDEQPIERARVETDGGFEGRTDAEGAVTVKDLAAEAPSTIAVAAAGFETRTVHLAPPLPREERVVLERTFSIKGSVVTENGAPVPDAVALVTIGSRYERVVVGSDGAFSIDVAPGVDFDLTVESPSAATVTRKEPPGRRGEVRELGEIRLPAGLAVRGRVTDSAGVAVRGARVWTVRPSAGGAVTAWTAGRVVQASSDGDGAFTLRGLAPGPAVLRIDAPDFARAYRDVDVDIDGVNLGVIVVDRGQTVTVERAPDNSLVARLDLRGHLLDVDMISAPVVEGEARLHHVPAGRYEVTVVDARGVVCQRHVEVKAGTDAAMQCPPSTTVRGLVLLGGVPAPGGKLTWVQASRTDALVETRTSPLGAMQQRVYGVSGGVAVLQVRPDGSFETDQLRPGEWQVSWRSADSSGTADRPFRIPEGEDVRIVIEFDGGAIRGRVVDRQGKVVAGARVREVRGPLHALSAADGTFTMTAVDPGKHRLQAMSGAQSSRVVEVAVEAGRETPEVVLEIGSTEEDVLAVRVVDADGQPRGNAFVFVEVGGGAIKIITSDAAGLASTVIGEELPEIARLVAYAGDEWAFGELRKPTDRSYGPREAVIRFGRGGSLRIRSRSVAGAPMLVSPRVPGDLIWLLGRIGSFVSVRPEAPLVISGLPTGTYHLSLDGQSRTATVTAGSTTTVDLP